MYITVEGLKCKVIEDVSTPGIQAKFVEYPNEEGERVAVKEGGTWRWWTTNDRLGGGKAK